MMIVDLAEVDAGMIDLVGGKAAGLGEMIRAGERVPAGFCVTTEAHRAGAVPEAALVAAYERLGGGPVAVRSSATAEDLPDASFAGQQDTYLGIHGADALVDAVRRCWDSLDTERAVAYRQARGIDDPAMAVVVQRMVDADVAGVLFTANPITGTRTEMVVDAAPGLGTAVVDGSVDADHYVLGEGGVDGDSGCLTPAQLDELRRAGRRLEQHFGSPQDAEWAFDHDGTLWLLQSRAITTLIPLPDTAGDGDPRVYFEFGHMEGMLRPCTPMGMSAFRLAVRIMAETCGFRVDPHTGPRSMVDIAGRLYVDITALVRDARLRKRLPDMLRVYGPRSATALEHVLADPRFAPRRGRAIPVGPVVRATLRYGPGATVGIVGALVRPDPAREGAFAMIEQVKRTARPPAHLQSTRPGLAAERLLFARGVQGPVLRDLTGRSLGAISAAMLARQVPAGLLAGIATEDEVEMVMRGMPHNVTTEMNLKLWHLAERAGQRHRTLLLETPPEELAARYLAGMLPDIGLDAFLDEYGQRGAAEADIGVPRWGEDPAPLFASIANYLRITDPEQAPDRRFAEAAREAEAKLAELTWRGRRSRPVRGRLAAFFLRRARALAGLRELGKFLWLFPLDEMRRQLLLVGAELTAQGLLDRDDDVMYLTLDEAERAVAGDDLRALVAQRRLIHEREMRRPSVPGLLLSDGTDVETVAPRPPAPDGALLGMAAASGTATGPARVIRDPSGAHIEPGEILVAPTTDPGWTPLFLPAAGLVTETGSPMAHGPTVAREYGIPAVIGVADATRRITTGQVVTIDGAAGTVVVDAVDGEPHAETVATPGARGR